MSELVQVAVVPAARAALAVASLPGTAAGRRADFHQAHRLREIVLGSSGLLAALLAMPLAPHANSAELAAGLAVAAIALLAGHRWAVTMVVMAELLLLPNMLLRATAVSPIQSLAAMAALGASLAVLPGLMSVRHAASALVSALGFEKRRARYRLAQLAVLGAGVIGVVFAV